MSRKDQEYTSASQLAELGFCEVAMLMRTRHGDRATPAQQISRRRGEKEHERFDEQAVAHHNRLVKDSRCFIATAVYGRDDPRTEQLRDFRDQVLMRRWWGRAMVGGYYTMSPWVVRVMAGRPGWTSAAKRLVDVFRRMMCR